MFDRIVIVDWSASSVPKWGADSIWTAEAGPAARPPVFCGTPVNFGTRDLACRDLHRRITAALARGERLLIGADFPFGYPAGFARALTGRDGALAVWDHLSAVIRDDAHNRNNRFAVASAINAALPGIGPFWGCPAAQQTPDLPQKGSLRSGHPFADFRQVEAQAKGAQSCWKLFTTGSVGSQALMGIPRMAALRAEFAGKVAVWPFEDIGDAPVVLAEVFPSLLSVAVKAVQARFICKDAAQVAVLAQALYAAVLDGGMAQMLAPDVDPSVLREEGWILGAGYFGPGGESPKV